MVLVSVGVSIGMAIGASGILIENIGAGIGIGLAMGAGAAYWAINQDGE